MIWHEDWVETLRAGVAEGMTGTEISRLMLEKHGVDLTRNSIIGKMSRLGVKSKNQPCSNITDGKIVRSKVAKPLPSGGPAAKLAESLVDSLLALEPHECRWPLETHFCAETRVIGFPYCAAHCAVSYSQRTR